MLLETVLDGRETLAIYVAIAFGHLIIIIIFCRKDGQDTEEELRKRNLRDELEDRERRHFSSKDKSYGNRFLF